MDEIEVKGLAFVSILGAIDELQGQEFRKRVVEAMPNESRAAIQLGSLIASGWYPVRWYRELFAAVVALSSDPGLPLQLGRTSMRRDLKSIHRLLFKVVSIEFLQSQGARFFKTYFRPTEASVERRESCVARVRYQGCFGFDRNIWQEQTGSVEELLSQSGVAAPRVRVLFGGGDHDARMELETRWR